MPAADSTHQHLRPPPAHTTPDPRLAHEQPHPVHSAGDGEPVEGRKGSAGEWRIVSGGGVMGILVAGVV